MAMNAVASATSPNSLGCSSRARMANRASEMSLVVHCSMSTHTADAANLCPRPSLFVTSSALPQRLLRDRCYAERKVVDSVAERRLTLDEGEPGEVGGREETRIVSLALWQH